MSSEVRDGLDRRGFLTRGLARAVGRAASQWLDDLAPSREVRPPGALPEAAFLAACTRCGACAEACPVHAIRLGSADDRLSRGTPLLELATTACIMCEDMPCAAVCPTDALGLPAGGWAEVRLAVLVIDEARCLPFRGVGCGVCARVCPVGAAALALDDRGRPVLGAACTGCGACITACVTAPGSLAASPP